MQINGYTSLYNMCYSEHECTPGTTNAAAVLYKATSQMQQKF